MTALKTLSAIAIATGLSCAAMPAFPATLGPRSEVTNSIGNLGLAAIRVEQPNNGHSVKPPLDGEGIVINLEPGHALYARPPVVREAPAPAR